MSRSVVNSLIIIIVLVGFNQMALGANDQRVALVIGNGSYKEAPLRNPVNDAEDMAALLERLGFQVTKKLNATQRQIEQAINAFGRKLRDGGVGLFYFAGHGVQVDGINYLIPIGADIETAGDVKYEAVNANRVLSKMQDAGNPLNMVFLDACRNNPFARRFRSAERALAPMEAPKGSFVAYATAPGDVADEGSGRNGVFTKHLLRYMQEPGVEIARMMRRVRVGVQKDTSGRQTPFEVSSLTGDFYFNPVSFRRSRLWVDAEPKNARIRLLNIKPKFFQGMELEPGNYHLEVTAAKYETERRWIELQAGHKAPFKFQLVKVKIAKPTSHPRFITNSIGMKFILIPAGSFMMGSKLSPEELVKKYSGKANWFKYEHPRHSVNITRPFYLQSTEVTVGQWRKFMNETGYKTEAETGICYAWDGSKWKKKKGARWDNPGYSQDDRHPVTCVSWNGVHEFIRWLNGKEKTAGYRLPTEAEWEYAVRSESSTEFSFGNDANKLADYAWYRANAGYKAGTVGQKKSNTWGFYDMHGNVWEWVEDDWHGDYNGAPDDGRAWVDEPRGGDRVIRGGGWGNGSWDCRSASRAGLPSDILYVTLGFRLVRSVTLRP